MRFALASALITLLTSRSVAANETLFHLQAQQKAVQTSAQTYLTTSDSSTATSTSIESFEYQVFSPADSTSCVVKAPANERACGSSYAILISQVGLTSQCVQVWVAEGVSTVKVEIVGGEWITFNFGATNIISSVTSWTVVQNVHTNWSVVSSPKQDNSNGNVQSVQFSSTIISGQQQGGSSTTVQQAGSYVSVSSGLKTKPSSKSAKSPTVPKSKGPTVPKSKGPTVPKSKGPTVPKSKSPTVPKSKGPTVPKSKGPTVPKSKGPTVPKSKSPTVPKSKGPTVPKSKSPKATRQPIPKVQDTPFLTNQPVPKVPPMGGYPTLPPLPDIVVAPTLRPVPDVVQAPSIQESPVFYQPAGSYSYPTLAPVGVQKTPSKAPVMYVY
jgi:hypothetical protein